MHNKNNNTMSGSSKPLSGQPHSPQLLVAGPEIDAALAAVDHLLNQMEQGDATAAGSLQQAVAAACQLLTTVKPDARLPVMTTLKQLLTRVDALHGNMQEQRDTLQEMLGSTSNNNSASRAYLRAGTAYQPPASAPPQKNSE